MNAERFEDIYRQYYTQISAFFMKRISVHEDSEEMAEDVFTNFYKSIEHFDEERCSVATWLYVIANNRLKNYYKAKKNIVSIDEVEYEIPASEPTIEDAVTMEESRKELLDALEQLSEREKSIVVMRFYQDKSGEEVAASLGITQGNVRIIQKRALDKLKNILNEQRFELVAR